MIEQAEPARPCVAPEGSPPPPEIALSPFYHSAVSAVTEPGRFVACSHYFVTRWMPLLGGEGTRLVLALRSLGYYNPRTGERRDQIVVGHAELAARVGCSEDTLTRLLGADRASGLPRHPALAHFVERERRVRRDPHTGRVWQEENAYRVAMDDPVHPDDWPLVVQKAAEREAQQKAQAAKNPPGRSGPPAKERTPRSASASRSSSAPGPPSPGPQSAVSARPPGPQNAVGSPQSAGGGPQNAGADPQSAAPLKESLYSSLPEKTGMTVALPAESTGSVGKEESFRKEDHGRQSAGRPQGAADGIPRPLPDQTGFAAFREVVAQLRAHDPNVRKRGSADKSEVVRKRDA